MKKTVFIMLSSLFLFACGNNNNEGEVKIEEAQAKENPIDTYEERTLEIQKYTAILFEDSLNFNMEAAEKLLAAYEDFLKYHSFESESFEIEYKAGELAKAMNKPHVAIKHFNNLLDRRPQHEKAPMALFQKAMIVGDMLGEHETAKIFYQEFIDKYPDHPFVESAKASIEMQGKDLNEIVKEFEQKNANS